MTIANTLTELLAGLRLPPHVHATVLTGRDVVTGETLAYPVVWADRTTGTCDQCKQPIPREVACPVTLDTGAGQGGRIEEFSQQHGCGNWLPVLWAEVQVDVEDADADEQIEAAATDLAGRREEELEAEQGRIRVRLARELKWALRELSTPLDPGETPDERITAVSTGSDIEPGVYLDDTSQLAWVAWDYDPDGAADGAADTIDATAGAVTLGQAANMLGVSRKRVLRLAEGGKLDRHPDGGVTVASVLRRRNQTGDRSA